MSLRTLQNSMKQLESNLHSMQSYCDSIIQGLHTTKLDTGIIDKFNTHAENTINILQTTLNSSNELEIVLKNFNSNVQGFIITTNSLLQVGGQIKNASAQIENAFNSINELVDEFSNMGDDLQTNGFISVSVTCKQNGNDTDINTGIDYSFFTDFYEDYKKLVSDLLVDVKYWYTEIFEKDDT